MTREIYSFGNFELDVDAHRLTRGGERVELPPLSFDLLLCLVRAAPDSVSRESLTETLWPDAVVGDETLTERVKLLRRELETSDDARLILTERGWGYRLAVTPVRAGEVDRSEATASRASRTVLLVIAAVLVAGGILFAFMQQKTDRGGPITLAIRPFADLSSDGDAQHIASGVAEELNAALARTSKDRLFVIGQVTSAGIGEDAAAISALNIDYLLDGSIRNRNNTRVVAVQLTRVADARQVWSYEAPIPDSGSLRWQRDLVNEVSIALTIGEARSSASADDEISWEARDAYLRGRYAWRHWTTQGFAEGLAHFERAIALEPDYVDAHAGLADALGTLAYTGALPYEDAFERARRHAQLAIDLSPESAEARSSMAMIILFADWQPAEAASVLSSLLQSDPNNGRLLLAMANVRWTQGCQRDAVSLMRRATQVDPHSPIMRSGLAASHYMAGDYSEARTQASLVLDAEPGYAHAIFVAAMSAAMMGDHEDALRLLNQADGGDLISARGYSLAASGDVSAAAVLLDTSWSDRAYLARARLLAALGRADEAGAEIEAAVRSKEPTALLANRYPALRDVPLPASVEAELARLDGDCL